MDDLSELLFGTDCTLRKGGNNFLRDFAKTERLYPQHLPVIEKAMGWRFLRKIPGKFKLYDVIYLDRNGKEVKVEHKDDFMNKDTGNAFIETEHVDKDGKLTASGVMGTTAAFVAHFLPSVNSVYLYVPAVMRKAIEEHPSLFRPFSCAGDGNANGKIIVVEKMVAFIAYQYEFKPDMTKVDLP